MPPTPSSVFHNAGPGNVYIPASIAGRLSIEFSRNPASFPLMRYTQIIPTDKLSGYYPEWGTRDAIRVVTLNDHVWPDGQERPRQDSRTFKWRSFDCIRYNYGFKIGSLTKGQADIDVIGANARMKAAVCMTERSVEALTLLETSGNWGNNTAATIDALLGGSGKSWNGATVANPYIFESFLAVKNAVAQSTGGVVTGSGLICVVNPNTAKAMGASAEIRDYMRANPMTMVNLSMGSDSGLNRWGLPAVLYDVQIVVEDSVKVTTRRDEDGSTDTTAYVMSDNKAVFLYRPGGAAGLVGPATSGDNNAAVQTGATLAMFAHEEMTIEGKSETWDRLEEGAVVDTRDFRITTPASGYLIQDTST